MQTSCNSQRLNGCSWSQSLEECVHVTTMPFCRCRWGRMRLMECRWVDMIIMGGTILYIYIYTYMYTTRLTYAEKYGKCMVGSNFFGSPWDFPLKLGMSLSFFGWVGKNLMMFFCDISTTPDLLYTTCLNSNQTSQHKKFHIPLCWTKPSFCM